MGEGEGEGEITGEGEERSGTSRGLGPRSGHGFFDAWVHEAPSQPSTVGLRPCRTADSK